MPSRRVRFAPAAHDGFCSSSSAFTLRPKICVDPLTGQRVTFRRHRGVMKARLLRSLPLFELPPELIAELRVVRDARSHDDLTREHDAFLLDPGLGPPTYLTTDGRILWEDDTWGVRGTRADATAAIFAGIQKTG